MLGKTATITVLGVGVGLVGAAGLTRFLAGMLFEVKPTDQVTFLGVVFLVLAIAFMASYIPARRAMKVDPMVALRYE